MITILDLIVVVLIVFYLLRNIGGIFKTLKSLLVVMVALIIFGLLAQFLMTLPLASPIHDNLRQSYFVRLSSSIIKWLYPSVEQQVPKLDAFIKDKILTPSQEGFKVTPTEKELPKLYLPELPKEK
jgi:hypothetical protein